MSLPSPDDGDRHEGVQHSACLRGGCLWAQRAQDSQWLVKNILSKAQAMSDRPLFERLKSMRLASLKAIKHGDAGKLHAVVQLPR